MTKFRRSRSGIRVSSDYGAEQEYFLHMSTKSKDKVLSEEEINNLVVAQADNDSAWENPIHVQKAGSTTIALSLELAARAAFFARLQRKSDSKGSSGGG